MTLEALIVDDEPLARERIRELLAENGDIRVTAECRNGVEALRAIEERRPDMVFLDVRMPELDGLEVVRRIGRERMPPFVLVTAFDEYAPHAFDAEAVDYLRKPFDRDRFARAVERVVERCQRRQLDALRSRLTQLVEREEARSRYADRLVVKSQGGMDIVRVDDIDWIEAARNYVKIHAGTELHVMRETMAHLEARLDPERFVRIHRSTILHLDRVKRIRPGYGTESVAELLDGTRLVISRAYRRGKVKALLA